MNDLPFAIAHVGVPPIKCQGIKTKLVPFLFRSICWTPKEKALWVEPFLGSGVVAFNLAPQRALLTDTNRHIIAFYQAIQAAAKLADNAPLPKCGKNDGLYRFHDLRRGFSTMNAESMSLFDLQVLMQHKTLATTQG